MVEEKYKENPVNGDNNDKNLNYTYNDYKSYKKTKLEVDLDNKLKTTQSGCNFSKCGFQKGIKEKKI